MMIKGAQMVTPTAFDVVENDKDEDIVAELIALQLKGGLDDPNASVDASFFHHTIYKNETH
jgi:hypothetical protein